MKVDDKLKLAYELAKKFATLEQQKQMLDLRNEVFELEQENLTLKQENSKLKEQIGLQKNLKFENGVYWKIIGDKKEETPYCAHCFDSEQKLIHMHHHVAHDGPYWHCTRCNKFFIKKE